jgi:PPOX class probable F420-dependent enzyme
MDRLKSMRRATLTKEQLDFLSRTRVARLATADQNGQPHVIPIVFATDGSRLFTPLDEKPKRLPLSKLKRVRNLSANPKLSIIVDEYDEDWSRLGWVLVAGTGEIVNTGDLHTAGARLLRQKYPQYATMSFENRPLIVVTPNRITSWGRI